MAITKIQLLSIPVSDQERAKAFYVDTLGFELESDEEMGPDSRWIMAKPRGADSSIALVTWFDSMPAGSLRGLILETDSLEDEVERLRAAGVVFDGDIEEQPWGRFATFSDPDGNGLILQSTSSSNS